MKDKNGKFSFGATGIGSTAHVSLLAFCAAGGLECNYVPYDGGSEAMLAMLGGEIDAVVGGSQQILGQLKSGDIRIVANIGTTRSESIKMFPLLLKWALTLVQNTLNGLLGPAGMDPKIITILHDAFKAALEDKRVVEAMNAAGIEIAYANPEDFKKVLYSMSKDYGVILKQLGLIK
jgi:tripartite-type tricarboxylate transporter receptor subunit TctC